MEGQSMAAAEAGKATSDMEEVLKPFFQRASEAEDRLAKLEALLARKGETDGGCANMEISSIIINDFQSKLEAAQAELASERDKAAKEIQKLTAENRKLQYRITHLISAVKDADAKLTT
ncbi:uncharacterized protein LOC121989782 [Zingiber officinale]|uniref:uncharacterized protein LOC121989782 n=1 Tax=Zingiber officinale TaxID=94328 RepID=UPI001C4D51A0|nr:uncharacterized protein LOC121989782 [Zingiber officinale]